MRGRPEGSTAASSGGRRQRLGLAVAGLLLALPAPSLGADPGFRASQLKHARVRDVQQRRGDAVRQMFVDRGLPYPPRGVAIRVFKREEVLELWGRRAKDDRYELVREYPICANSGTLGPKRREGDLQVPEGFYFLNHFNPDSNFHLSLGVSYPNQSDRILGDKKRPGGAIYIHGACATIGCVPITDDKIEEVYLAALEARASGQSRIPIHIFPARLDEPGMKRLRDEGWEPSLVAFWDNLQQGYAAFEATHRLPNVTIDRAGRYVFSEERGRSVSPAAQGSTRNPSPSSVTR